MRVIAGGFGQMILLISKFTRLGSCASGVAPFFFLSPARAGSARTISMNRASIVQICLRFELELGGNMSRLSSLRHQLALMAGIAEIHVRLLVLRQQARLIRRVRLVA